MKEIKNWRPVSLLCVDFKILSKALANRLKKVMGQIIHNDQSYCVPERSIIDNITVIRDVFEVAKLAGQNFGLISLDQEKAFDRVEHKYLWNAFMSFGIPYEFTKLIKILYSDIESIVKGDKIIEG